MRITEILLTLSVWVAGTAALDAAEIRLRAECRPASPLVRLGDVAELVPQGQETSAELARLAAIPLMPAPALGRDREVRHQEIRELLALHGIDWRQHRLVGARTLRLLSAHDTNAAVVSEGPPGKATVVVLTRPIERGERLQEADLALAPVAAQTAAGLSRTIAEVLGLEVVHSLQAGQPLQATDLRKPLLVRKQSLVQVTARAAGVQVRTQAKALQDGARGDVILVESLESRQKYSARVVDADRLEVYASGISLAAETVAPAPAAATLREEL